MKGQKPTPAALQHSLGDPSKRGKRKVLDLVRSEARGARGLPDCPPHLAGLARKQYKFWVEQLELMELDHQPDGAALEAACVQYARAVEIDREIKTLGAADPRDMSAIASLMRLSNTSWSLVVKFASEFGFTPISRTRTLAGMPPPAPKDDLEQLLSAPRERKVQPEAIQ